MATLPRPALRVAVPVVRRHLPTPPPPPTPPRAPAGNQTHPTHHNPPPRGRRPRHAHPSRLLQPYPTEPSFTVPVVGGAPSSSTVGNLVVVSAAAAAAAATATADDLLAPQQAPASPLHRSRTLPARRPPQQMPVVAVTPAPGKPPADADNDADDDFVDNDLFDDDRDAVAASAAATPAAVTAASVPISNRASMPPPASSPPRQSPQRPNRLSVLAPGGADIVPPLRATAPSMFPSSTPGRASLDAALGDASMARRAVSVDAGRSGRRPGFPADVTAASCDDDEEGSLSDRPPRLADDISDVPLPRKPSLPTSAGGGGLERAMHKLFAPYGLPPTERLLHVFMCATPRSRILQQGHLFLTPSFVMFHANIFGFQTTYVLHKRDVAAVEPARTAMVIPNAVMVTTREGAEFFFTSFVQREKALACMRAVVGGEEGDGSSSGGEASVRRKPTLTTAAAASAVLALAASPAPASPLHPGVVLSTTVAAAVAAAAASAAASATSVSSEVSSEEEEEEPPVRAVHHAPRKPG
ncbi:hypothetical protein HDU96_003540, partial [Phlyctochytrium bullatum]